MIHYHGTPITPIAALYELAGRHFCVSHAAPGDVARCHAIGQSVMLDNGAFSKWRTGKATDWSAFYDWAEPWLSTPTTWAIIPDVIDAGEDAQDALITQWPFGAKGAPVWHIDEPILRLLRLIDAWPKVCVGSAGAYATPMSPAWQRRMDDVFDAVGKRRFLPWLHMLRGMQCSGRRWPFGSVDSTDVARNHNEARMRSGALADEWEQGAHKRPARMAARWDAMQCPSRWDHASEQLELA